MKISKETQIGIFGIVAITMLFFGFRFLKGSDFFSKTYTYYVLFDNVGALQPSNPVKLNGVQVGRVKSTEILQDHNDQVLVVLEINNKIILRQGSTALLTSELLGGSTIMLAMAAKGGQMIEGDTLVSTKAAGIQELLQTSALPVLKNVDSLSKSLTKIVLQFDKTGYTLNKLLGSTDKTMGSVNGLVEQNQKGISMVLANLNQLAASLIETEKGLKPILGNLKTTTDSLKALQLGQTLRQANMAIGSLQKTLSGLESGQGTAGKLLKDDLLYTNLNRTMISLNKLMTNFREYPKRYVNVSIFGKKDKGPAESMADTTTK